MIRRSPSTFISEDWMVCAYCKTSLFLEDEAVKSAGEKSVITDIPSIFSLGKRYSYKGDVFETLGRIQFDYGGGYWDEWWVIDDKGRGFWISMDEGDVAIEKAVKINTPADYDRLPDCDSLEIGQKIRLPYAFVTISEIGSAECAALEGKLPEVISPGERHEYAHGSGKKGELLTLECCEGKKTVYEGRWVDPFEIKAR